MLRAGRGLVAIVMAFFAVWLLALRPAFLGGPASYVMVTGRSMEPTLREGDLVIIIEQGSYRRGNIVAFRVPSGEPGEGAIIIHRIVSESAGSGFVTQGDNKDAPDPWRPTYRDVLGKMWLRVPGAGRVLGRLRAPLPLATLAGGLAFLFALYGPRSGASAPPMPRSSGPRPAVPSDPGLGGRSARLGDTWAFGPRRWRRS